MKDLYTKEKEALFYYYLSIPSLLHLSQASQYRIQKWNWVWCPEFSLKWEGLCLPPSSPRHPLSSIICKKQEKGWIGCISFNTVNPLVNVHHCISVIILDSLDWLLLPWSWKNDAFFLSPLFHLNVIALIEALIPPERRPLAMRCAVVDSTQGTADTLKLPEEGGKDAGVPFRMAVGIRDA